MGRLLHLSDLHFGTDRPELIAPLTALCHRLAPDLTVISGDLTQRARNGQWHTARKFIAGMPGPVLCVPGNHDMPLYNIFMRLLAPLSGYRSAIARDLEPMAETPDLRVIGMNTADPHVWQRGLIRPASLKQAVDRLQGAKPGQLRVVVMHHPLFQPPETGKAGMKGADAAALALAEAGADLILTGHLHKWAADPFTLREGGRRMLCVQAGTTLSTRLRGTQNDFNLIEYDGTGQTGGLVRVTRYHAVGESAAFTPDSVTHFRQDDRKLGWGRHAE